MIRNFKGKVVAVQQETGVATYLTVQPTDILDDDLLDQDLFVDIIPKPGLMEPASLSASAALKFELCEAGYRASNIDRVPSIAGKAGLQGNAVHEALQFWIESGQYLKFIGADYAVRQQAIKVVWEMTYWNYFPDASHYESGFDMLLTYIGREDWDGRTVMETEVKKSFDLPTSKGPLTFNYILDRKDRLASGEIEVVDYKTVARPIQADDMKKRIQPRAYAVAMFIEHKALGEDLEGVWVTYDLLRYNRVSVYFTRDECIETYKYLIALAERIYKSDGTRETLNPECRFCERKQVCGTLKRHEEYGGPLSITSLEEASERLLLLQNAKGGLDAAIDEVKAMALEFAEADEVIEWTTDTVEGKVTAKGRREADSERISKVVGPEIMARYGKLTLGLVEKILKEEDLTDDQKSQVKQFITKKFGEAYVEVKPRSVFEED